MEPTRKTQADLLAVQKELIQREPIFHHPEYGTTRQAFEAMTAEEFWETGASGRRYSREFVIDTALKRSSKPYDDQFEAGDFYCQEISPDHYLLTYTLHQGKRVTRRTTLWRRLQDRWVAVYHQGTIVEKPEAKEEDETIHLC